MIKYDTVLIRYGELSTKGKNRRDFIKRLDKNIRRMLKDYEQLEYRRTHDRIYIKLNGADPEGIREKLSKVFGISSFSFTERVASNMEEITETCLRIAKEEQAKGKKTFKMKTKRHDKTFELKSDGVNRACATEILKNTDFTVDVHNPELLIQVEIHQEETYITYEKIKGAGGYPTGINGKVLLMLSGGIDSPVAAYQLMKRGLDVEAIHYASPPYTSDAAKGKVMDLARIVSEYQGYMKVHVVDFTPMQLEIYKTSGDPYAITLMRRMMYRIAERQCENINALAIGTGESVGQVASQTLESINVINNAIHMPVFRPLVCLDKLEIIDLAKKIGTYETSILPFEDCCTIFDPKNPVTKPTLKKVEFYESKFDWESLLDQCMNSIESELVHYDDLKEEEDFL